MNLLLLIFATLVLSSDATSFSYPSERTLPADKPYKDKLDELVKLEGLAPVTQGLKSQGSAQEEQDINENLNSVFPNPDPEFLHKPNHSKPDPCQKLSPGLSFKPPKIGSAPLSTFENLWSVTKSFIENKVVLGQAQVSLRNSIRWRRNTTQLLIDIFRRTVPGNTLVPIEFFNVARELVLTHFEGVKEHDRMKHKEAWDRLIPQLMHCRDQLRELYFRPSSGVANDVVSMDNDTTVDTSWIIVPEEAVDKIPNLDLSIEVLWYLFSFSMGSCYYKVDITDRIMWAVEYFQAFQDDFIVPIVHKWISGFTQIQQGIMFGDFNVLKAMKNLRVIVSAIYGKNGILDRQLNRPMRVHYLNSKTGNLLL